MDIRQSVIDVINSEKSKSHPVVLSPEQVAYIIKVYLEREQGRNSQKLNVIANPHARVRVYED